MAKTVCIVGAGPSGLVAAKSLLRDVPQGTFDVTIFEAENRIGGLWPLDRVDEDGMVHPDMVTNQSRHTVQFSDCAWDPHDPQFPSAWQVGRYLDRYRQRYLHDVKLRLGIRVKKAELVQLSQEDESVFKWKVHTGSHYSEVEQHTFDHLLVATGYFGSPIYRNDEVAHVPIPICHSSQYRNLEHLLSKLDANGNKQLDRDKKLVVGKGKKILVVGGQMSGVEIAATIATQLSTAVHSPAPTEIPAPETYSVHHLTQRPVWVFPLYTSPKPTLRAPPFLPLDLSSYNLASRPKHLVNTQGHISTEAARNLHSIFKNTLGTDQSIYSPNVAIADGDTERPPYLAVSDTYMEFVRSGLITVSRGRFDSVWENNAVKISNPNYLIQDVAAMVVANGFEAPPSISFLPLEVLEKLSLSLDMNNAVALAFHGTHHPDVPNLGFVGFYRSPYWGVMEMQARFLAALWHAGGPKSPSLPRSMAAALHADTSIERAISLRTDPHVSQFPMGDYPWLMQEFASALGLERSPHTRCMPILPAQGAQMDVLTPARYSGSDITARERGEVVKSLMQTEQTVWDALTEGKFVAKAVFRALQGKWKLERDLVSKLPEMPGGKFSGTAEFLLREQTREGRTVEYDKIDRADLKPGLEYLYVERGQFTMNTGYTYDTSRRYVYRYDEEKDRISVWFVKTDKPKEADYFFHNIEFQVPPLSVMDAPSHAFVGWKATADHLCSEDFYDVDYTFNFNAINITDWRLQYRVSGPRKDYSIDGIFKRWGLDETK